MSGPRPHRLRRLATIALTLAILRVAALAAQEHGPEQGEPAYVAGDHDHLGAEHGGQTLFMVQGDRLEYGFSDGEDGDFLLWDLQAWLGGDLNRLWIKAEGEYLTDAETTEEGEIQALYSRAVSPYFDLQLGVRHDFEPSPSRTLAVLGLQGLAPYWFELDTALFVSEDGDVSARIEAEYEILITQRLIAQPRLELDLAASDVPELAIESGLVSYEVGLRLRYEILRELAPYVGVSWTGLDGGSADLAEAAGEPTSSVALVAGLRFWY
jgi:copper resistance protein B